MTELKTLVYDTETNGKRKKPPRRDNEPAITQIAAILFLGRRPVAHLSTFVIPQNYDTTPATIPTDQFFIDNGITQDVVDAAGMPLKIALAMFNNLVKRADRMVAHNMEFDYPITESNYTRVAAPQDHIKAIDKFCTMQSLTDVMKLPSPYGHKFPSLDEAYRAFIDPMGFEGAHDAMNDVIACTKLLWAIEDAIADNDPRFVGRSLWKKRN